MSEKTKSWHKSQPLREIRLHSWGKFPGFVLQNLTALTKGISHFGVRRGASCTVRFSYRKENRKLAEIAISPGNVWQGPTEIHCWRYRLADIRRSRYSESSFSLTTILTVSGIHYFCFEFSWVELTNDWVFSGPTRVAILYLARTARHFPVRILVYEFRSVFQLHILYSIFLSQLTL